MAPRGIQDTELGRSAGTIAVIVTMKREGNGSATVLRRRRQCMNCPIYENEQPLLNEPKRTHAHTRARARTHTHTHNAHSGALNVSRGKLHVNHLDVSWELSMASKMI